jgi:glucosamine-6-phosphate deaminase
LAYYIVCVAIKVNWNFHWRSDMCGADGEVERFQTGKVNIEVHPTREDMGSAAAKAAGEALKKLAQARECIGVIFATGASQIHTLRALVNTPSLPWHKVYGFHMDEYIGLSMDHRASFRRYLRERLTQRVRMREFFEIEGMQRNPEQVCREYAEMVRSTQPQLCFLGIGENGHLAFNDPGDADFNDPVDMKIVHLDAMCRQQQVAEGWFQTVQEVPELAMTLTIPALLRVPKLIVSVTGPRKADIVRRSLEEPITSLCPATILRNHPDATIFLDHEAAAQVRRPQEVLVTQSGTRHV